MQWLDPYDDEAPYPPPINHIGIDRLALAVTDLDLAVSTLREEGAEFFRVIPDKIHRRAVLAEATMSESFAHLKAL